MKGAELYSQTLGDTEPWHVESVTLDRAAQEIVIRMALGRESWA